MGWKLRGSHISERLLVRERVETHLRGSRVLSMRRNAGDFCARNPKSAISHRKSEPEPTHGFKVGERESTELGEDRLDVFGTVLSRAKEVRVPATLGDAVVLRLDSNCFSDPEGQLQSSLRETKICREVRMGKGKRREGERTGGLEDEGTEGLGTENSGLGKDTLVL